METHFGTFAEEMAMVVESGKRGRAARKRSESIEVPAAMLALGTPSLVEEMSRQGGDAIRYTTDLDKAVRKEILGRSGFEGAIWHSPHFGPITLQSDPVATPRTIRILDPTSWFMFTAGEGRYDRPEWLTQGGQRFIRRTGSTSVYPVEVGGAVVDAAIGCDCPKANYQLGDVKSSLQSA